MRTETKMATICAIVTEEAGKQSITGTTFITVFTLGDIITIKDMFAVIYEISICAIFIISCIKHKIGIGLFRSMIGISGIIHDILRRANKILKNCGIYELLHRLMK